MNDANARKRLKQRVLERWENEGGKIEVPKDKKDSSSKKETKEPRRGKKSGPRGKPTR
jgi:hypothetical protein